LAGKEEHAANDRTQDDPARLRLEEGPELFQHAGHQFTEGRLSLGPTQR
jgi:hypothetical protein